MLLRHLKRVPPSVSLLISMGCASSSLNGEPSHTPAKKNHEPANAPQRYRADDSNNTAAAATRSAANGDSERVVNPRRISGPDGIVTESDSFTAGRATPAVGSLPDRLINFGSAIDSNPLADEHPLHSLANSTHANSAYTRFGVSVVSVQSSTSFDGEDDSSFRETVNSTTAVRNF